MIKNSPRRGSVDSSTSSPPQEKADFPDKNNEEKVTITVSNQKRIKEPKIKKEQEGKDKAPENTTQPKFVKSNSSRELGSQRPGALPLDPSKHFHAITRTSIHGETIKADNNPGILSVAVSPLENWNQFDCSPNSLLGRVEINHKHGLINLIASDGFPLGKLSQPIKFQLQGNVAAVIDAYNLYFSEDNGDKDNLIKKTPMISIHENHFFGDKQIHNNEAIPRQYDDRDLDRYHTPGVPFAENKKMQPHYHLEFKKKPLTADAVQDILYNLSQIKKIDGHQIISEEEALNCFNLFKQQTGLQGTREPIKLEKRVTLPSEVNTDPEKAIAKDELEGLFIALSSANTFFRELINDDEAKWKERKASQAAESNSKEDKAGPFENAHMNNFRLPTGPEECFHFGHVQAIDVLQRVEKQPSFAGLRGKPMEHAFTLFKVLKDTKKALIAIHEKKIKNDDKNTKDLEALIERTESAMLKIQKGLSE
jgi:hypothetical protein